MKTQVCGGLGAEEPQCQVALDGHRSRRVLRWARANGCAAPAPAPLFVGDGVGGGINGFRAHGKQWS